MKIQSALLSSVPNLEHNFISSPSHYPNLPKWHQVHGIAFQWIQSVQQEAGTVDALLTRQMNQPIGVVTADCVPVMMAKKDGTMAATVHAGWRGLLADIIPRVWNELKLQAEDPKNWVAALGPAIGACCYEVSEELCEQFLSRFPAQNAKKISPSHRRIDLRNIAEIQLATLGIQQIDRVSECTCCARDPKNPERFLFHSYRRDKSSQRQCAVLVLNAKDLNSITPNGFT